MVHGFPGLAGRVVPECKRRWAAPSGGGRYPASVLEVELTHSYRAAFSEALLVRYRWIEVRNASAILYAVAPGALQDLTDVLAGFQLSAGHLIIPGGSKSAVAKELDEAFRIKGWRETQLQLTVEGKLTKRPWSHDAVERRKLPAERARFVSVGETHQVDNFKNRVAIEVEWNAKDGNLDRDLSAFRALYEAGVIDAAVIITRHHASVKLAANWLAHNLDRVNYTRGKEVERFNTTTTTNIEKLTWRIARGDAGGCPVLAVGISSATYTPGNIWAPDGAQGALLEQPAIPEPDAETVQALEAEAAAGSSIDEGDD
jgi:Restriction endonuclease BglII